MFKSSVSTATEQVNYDVEDAWGSKRGIITESSSSGSLPSVKNNNNNN